jgi:ABC-type transporter Mla subunit MlaD
MSWGIFRKFANGLREIGGTASGILGSAQNILQAARPMVDQFAPMLGKHHRGITQAMDYGSQFLDQASGYVNRGNQFLDQAEGYVNRASRIQPRFRNDYY